MSNVSSFAVSMMMGMVLILRISRQTCQPSMPGSIRSSRTMCGGFFLKRFSASSPRVAVSVSNPSFSR